MASLSLAHPTQQPHPDGQEQDDEATHYLGSFHSSTATESNLPGAGRNLGNVYSFLGRWLENGIRVGRSVIDTWIGHDPRTNDPRIVRIQQSTPVHRAEDSEGSFSLESAHSSTATTSNLPGAGRNLGNFYSFAGRYVESGASMIAIRTGFCPRAIAVRTRKILQTRDTRKASTRREVERRGRRLLAYAK